MFALKSMCFTNSGSSTESHATHGNRERERKGGFGPKNERSMGGVLQYKPVFYHCWTQNCLEWREMITQFLC